MATTIKVRENGSYLVEGEDTVLVDWLGNAYEIPKRPFSLCRCGHSHRKPFCDGTASHHRLPGVGIGCAHRDLGRLDRRRRADGVNRVIG